MRLLKRFCSVIFASSLFAATSVYADVVVVVGVDSPINEVTQSELARIFLGKAQEFGDGSPAIPVNHPEDSSSYVVFGTNYLKRNSSQLKGHWAKMMFSGAATPPKSVANDAEMVSFVSGNKGAIGYIDSGSLTGSVKTVVVN